MTRRNHQETLYDFGDQVVVLVGAGSGLTRQVSLALGSAGARTVLCDINEDGVRATAEEIRANGGEATWLVADVADPDQMEAVFQAADDLGGVTGLVVGAFMGSDHIPPAEVPLAKWQRIMEVNIQGAFIATQLAGRRMITQGAGGSIVTFSSIAGSSGMGRGNYPYSVSKGAINQMIRELAVEWGRFGIRVNAVQPCQFLTPGLRRWLDDPETESEALHQHFLRGIPLGRLGEVEDIVGPVLFLLSDAAAMVTGVMLPVDGGNLAMNAAGGHPET